MSNDTKLIIDSKNKEIRELHSYYNSYITLIETESISLRKKYINLLKELDDIVNEHKRYIALTSKI